MLSMKLHLNEDVKTQDLNMLKKYLISIFTRKFKRLFINLLKQKNNNCAFFVDKKRKDLVLSTIDKYIFNFINFYFKNLNEKIGEDFKFVDEVITGKNLPFPVEYYQKSNLQICVDDFSVYLNIVDDEFENLFIEIEKQIFNTFSIENQLADGDINLEEQFLLDSLKRSICYFSMVE